MALNDKDSSWVADVLHQAAVCDLYAAENRQILSVDALRPSRVFRPRLSIDGNQWLALYGENPQDGVAGFGASPEAAYAAFDAAWVQPLAIIGGK